jgi:hypothetical protein
MKINFVGTANLKDNYLTLPSSLEGKIKDQFKGNPLNKERWHEAFGAGAAEIVRHKQILFEHWDRQKNEPIESTTPTLSEA